MAKTIKKLLNYYLTQYPITEYLELFKDIIFDDILKAHEKELAEKDKEHKEQLKRMYEQFKHDKELEIGQYKFENEQQQLYKENFIVHQYCINCRDEEFPFDNKCRTCGWKRIIQLKDNSKYDKLPSKENK